MDSNFITIEFTFSLNLPYITHIYIYIWEVVKSFNKKNVNLYSLKILNLFCQVLNKIYELKRNCIVEQNIGNKK
jgi:hypothetical protein